MTKSSRTNRRERRNYRVSFMAKTCYRITLSACSEDHAVALAKREWFEGDCDAVIPYHGEDDGWYAELSDPPGPA